VNFFHEWAFISVQSRAAWMDERHTLTLLAWTIGSLVGIIFLLNGVALSLLTQRGLGVPSARPAVKTVTRPLSATNAQSVARGIE
jgi:hypothetical protein